METESMASKDVETVRDAEAVGGSGAGERKGVGRAGGVEQEQRVLTGEAGAASGEVGAGSEDVQESVEPYWRAGHGVTVPQYRPKDGDPVQPPKSVGFEDKGFHASECWRMDLGPEFRGHF
jgi:hypothetical protein